MENWSGREIVQSCFCHGSGSSGLCKGTVTKQAGVMQHQSTLWGCGRAGKELRHRGGAAQERKFLEKKKNEVDSSESNSLS